MHGGQQPVTGSHIYLYAVGQGGYGTAAQSLLGAQTGATLDSNGNYYVTTDSSGNFGFSTFTCPSKSATQTYLLALGGNPGYPGTSVNNTAISAIDAAGKCGSIGTSSFFDINELTTVAFVTAMQQYMTDATHVGAIGSLPNGVKVAAGLAIDLVNPAGPRHHRQHHQRRRHGSHPHQQGERQLAMRSRRASTLPPRPTPTAPRCSPPLRHGRHQAHGYRRRNAADCAKPRP